MDPVVLTAGEEVERYAVIRPIGSGGIADVYLVRHTSLDTEHALKVLKFTGPTLAQRLIDEGRVQAKIRHPNVVWVSDAFEVRGMPALVMEYVDGPDLSRWLEAVQPDLETAERLFRGIVAGVGAAHDAGVIHRDLKPANVLLAPGPHGPIPKVADFGLVKMLERTGPGHTHTGQPMGTPNYMAPEQIRNAAAVDRRADIHSLGCILYRLATHERAFPGNDAAPVFMRVATGRHAPIPETLPERIATTISRCLAVNPDDRPQDWREVLALLGDEPPLPTQIPIPVSPIVGTPWPPAPTPTMATGRTGPSGAGRVLGRVALAIPLLGFLGTAALALAAASVTVGILRSSAPDRSPEPCPTSGGLLGYAHAPWVFDKPVGSIWTVSGEARVGPLPGEGDTASAPACLLPHGVRVRLVEPLVRSEGEEDRWIPIYGEAIVGGGTDAPVERDQEGVVGERCTETVHERLGWLYTDAAYLGKRPRIGGTWTLKVPRYVLAEPESDAPTVCALREGTTVNVYEAPVEAGEGWWVPVGPFREGASGD